MTIKLPGTELEIVTKSPDSYRLDHPNFGDVYKTTFAKGVIKDFQQIQDDPIKVESLVKVEVGGSGESDYIPFFYHPKRHYWNDDQAENSMEPSVEQSPSSMAFDQDKGYFEKAWMSFRCGDEVAVMLKENEPVAVVGFADGKPKIGENLIKFLIKEWQTGNLWVPHIKCAEDQDGVVGQPYTQGSEEDPDGPDGMKLGLTEECVPEITEEDEIIHDCWGMADLSQEPGYPWGIAGAWFLHEHYEQHPYTYKFTVIVGPIEYLFTFEISRTIDTYGPNYEAYILNEGQGYWPQCTWKPGDYADPALVASFQGSGPVSAVGNTDGWFIILEKIEARQYKPEDQDELIEQIEFYNNIHFQFLGLVYDQDSLKLFVRPHNIEA